MYNDSDTELCSIRMDESNELSVTYIDKLVSDSAHGGPYYV